METKSLQTKRKQTGGPNVEHAGPNVDYSEMNVNNRLLIKALS